MTAIALDRVGANTLVYTSTGKILAFSCEYSFLSLRRGHLRAQGKSRGRYHFCRKQSISCKFVANAYLPGAFNEGINFFEHFTPKITY